MPKRKLNCKNCGQVTYLSRVTPDYTELDVSKMSPWRCEACGTVHEFIDPEQPKLGYKVVRLSDEELERMQRIDNDKNMQDSEQRRADRKPKRFTNRRMRRVEAKQAKLFKDRSGYAWREANAHMKGEPIDESL